MGKKRGICPRADLLERPPTAPERCVHRYFRLRPADIGYLRFLLEAYEGLAQMTSLPGRGEVEWVIPERLADQAEALARALEREIGLVPIPRPPDWDAPGRQGSSGPKPEA